MSIRLLFSVLLIFSVAPAAKSSGIQLRNDVPADTVTKLQAEYTENLEALEKARVAFGGRWNTAAANDRSVIVNEARQLLLETFYDEIFPAWFGTTWDFNGTTQTPGEGMIACGYFVTTCLKQAGFQCERVKLAQQASQKIIRTFADTKEEIKISSDLPMEKFLDWVRENGEGLYIVGLDTHTGFVAWDGETFAFIHSSYYRPPFSVTAEAADSKNPLKDSRYRMVGKILGDKMIRKWITGDSFQMAN